MALKGQLNSSSMMPVAKSTRLLITRPNNLSGSVRFHTSAKPDRQATRNVFNISVRSFVHWFVRLLRPHSIILASCKPGRKPALKQVESMSKASCELA